MTDDQIQTTDDQQPDDIDNLKAEMAELDVSDPDMVREAFIGVLDLLATLDGSHDEVIEAHEVRIVAIEEAIQAAQIEGLVGLLQACAQFLGALAANEQVPAEFRGHAQKLVAAIGQALGQNG